MKKPLMLSAVLLIGFFVAANVYAWENRYSPLLPGGPFLTGPHYALYSPLAYARFLWRWLPGYPHSFQLSAMLGLSSCAGVLMLAMKPSSQKKEPARWATRRDLKRKDLLRADGICLGTYHGTVVRQEKPGHLLVAAVTQSGKTSCLVIRSILEGLDEYSLVVHDPKMPAEIHDATAGHRSTLSHVVKFQPVSVHSHRYDPLAAVRKGTDYETRDLQILADMLGDPDGALSQKANEGSLHFSQLASDFNRGVFAHAIYTWPNCHMEDIYEMICGGDSMEALVADMKKARHIDGHIHPAVAFAVRTYEQTADRELSAFRNTAQRALRLWADPLVCRATSGSDFTLADVREASKPLSLYVSFPFEDQERLRPLSRLLIRQVLEESASRKDRPGEKRFPLFAVLDEFPTLGHFPILSYGLDYFLGMGVTMCLITPSMNRIHQIWGKDHPFLEGCATKVAFGMRDEKIARLFTGPIGMHPVSRSRTSTSRTGSSTSTEDHNEPLFSPQELMQLDDKKVLALIGNQHVILDKAPYYTNKKLLARSKMEIQP